MVCVLLTLSLTIVWNRVQAAPPNCAPPQKNLLTQVDAAANQHNVKAVIYGANFTHDGLTPKHGKGFDSTLQRYPLKYQTQLQSWKNGQAIGGNNY